MVFLDNRYNHFVEAWVPFYLHCLTLIPAWIINPIHFKVGWFQLFISKLQRCNRWGLVMAKSFHPTLYWACAFISRLGLKYSHASKRAPGDASSMSHCFLYQSMVRLNPGNNLQCNYSVQANAWENVSEALWYGNFFPHRRPFVDYNRLSLMWDALMLMWRHRNEKKRQ